MNFVFGDLAAADAAARRFGPGLRPEVRALMLAAEGLGPDGRPSRHAGAPQAVTPDRIAADPRLAAFPGPAAARGTPGAPAREGRR